MAVDPKKGPRKHFVHLPNDVSELSDIEIDTLAADLYEKLTNASVESYLVTFKGASLLGTSSGKVSFEKAHSKISQLASSGKATCYTRWCRACTLYKFKLTDDVTGHVVKISFPNVVSLSKEIKINWKWETPEGDWAKEKGDPMAMFKALVAKKSKPVFYVRLESQADIERRLGVS